MGLGEDWREEGLGLWRREEGALLGVTPPVVLVELSFLL
jgi:hypothetical protein